MYIVELTNGNITTEIHGTREKLKAGQVVKGINTIDSFTFTILPSNKGFDQIFDLQTLVKVYNTNKNRNEFCGRVLYTSGSMDASGKIAKEVICESYLGFLCDSQQPYIEEKNWTVQELFEHIINNHNSQIEDYKQFAVGDITVTDPNDNLYIGIQRKNSWETIEEKLLNKLGGELRFREAGGIVYLDYLDKIGSTLSTEIALAKNMVTITREDNPTDCISRLIPYGCKLKDDEGKETEKRLDITSVNEGLDYIESAEAVKTFGIRYGIVTFDDVTIASNLLRKGQEYLAENNKIPSKYSVDALDLSLLGLDINDFDVHNYYPIKNALLGIDDIARIVKKNIDIIEEIKSTIEFGDNFKTLSDLRNEQDANFEKIYNQIGATKNELTDYIASTEEKIDEKIDDTAESIHETITEQNTALTNTCKEIILEALTTYTETKDFETFKETVSSQLTLMSNEMNLKFTETTKQIESINGDLQEKFNTITKYFTFDINGLTIGQIDNPYKVIIDNDRYSMTVNGVEVMWIADGKVYTPELEVSGAFKLFDYLINQDAEGNVNCEYIGGDA